MKSNDVFVPVKCEYISFWFHNAMSCFEKASFQSRVKGMEAGHGEEVGSPRPLTGIQFCNGQNGHFRRFDIKMLRVAFTHFCR